MLVLKRKKGESILLSADDMDIVITVLEGGKGRIKFGIDACRTVKIYRPENCGGDEAVAQMRADIKSKNGKRP